MRESKVIKLIKRLSPSEIKTFDKYLNSSYASATANLKCFWVFLYSKSPNFHFKDCEIEQLYTDLFKKEKFDERKFRQLRYLLLELLKEFLAIERFKKDKFKFDKEVSDALLEKGLKDSFEKGYRKLQASFTPESFLTSSAIFQKLSLHHQLYFNEYHVKGDNPSKDLEECTRLLDKYYHYQKLLYAIEWYSISKRYSHSIPETIKVYSKLAVKDTEYQVSIINILQKAIQLFLQETDETDNIFKEILKLFEDNYTSINKVERNLVLRLLLNYCIGKVDKGDNKNKEIFKLYQLGLSDKAIFYKGLMTNATFINITSVALKSKQIQFAKKFIEKEQNRLYEPQKEQYINQARANIAFSEDRFDDCLAIMSRIEINNLTTLEIAKRNLQIRALFEEYIQNKVRAKMLLTYIDSFNRYLKRKNILSSPKKTSYRNFVKYVLRLVKWKDNRGTIKSLAKLRGSLIKIEPFPQQSKKWLLKHIELLEKELGLHMQPQ